MIGSKKSSEEMESGKMMLEETDRALRRRNEARENLAGTPGNAEQRIEIITRNHAGKAVVKISSRPSERKRRR